MSTHAQHLPDTLDQLAADTLILRDQLHAGRLTVAEAAEKVDHLQDRLEEAQEELAGTLTAA